MKLILVEGIPGAGKSTIAQRAAAEMRTAGLAARWLYEEEVGHTAYVFEDDAAARLVVEELRQRRFEGRISKAVQRWAEFATSLTAGLETVVADGCLFGYLTWSLFWADAPAELIVEYVQLVERALEAAGPLVVHLRPIDLEELWRELQQSRGDHWVGRKVAQVEASPRGARQKLVGFAGLVRYWSEYRGVADELFAGLRSSKHRVDMDCRDRDGALREVVRLLDLEGRSCVGIYAGDGGEAVEIVRVPDGGLALRGLPGAWPVVDLLPAGDRCFDLRGMPWRLAFEEDGFTVSGPPLFGVETARWAGRWRRPLRATGAGSRMPGPRAAPPPQD